MELFFNQLGYDVTEEGTLDNDRSITIFCIKNSDGSIRWFWPDFLDEPLFLKFYTVSNVKSWVLSTAVRFVFFLRLQGLFFSKRVVYYQLRQGEVSLFNLRNKWAAFTGTVGPNNKMNIYYEDKDKGSFIKLGNTQNAKELVQNETDTLNFLAKKSTLTFSFPKVLLATHNGVQLNDISEGTTRSCNLTLAHLRTLKEMSMINPVSQQLKASRSWRNVVRSAKTLTAGGDDRIPRRLVRKLNLLINSIDEDEIVETTFSHGDFTPWNMYICDKKLFIYDWELSSNGKPFGFDLFHFIIQNGILVKHQSWKELMQELQDYLDGLFFSRTGKESNLNGLLYLKLYLIYNITYYLHIYKQQAKWHLQVNWLLEVWEEALGNMLSESVTNRKLLIVDIFDFLSDKRYAAVKFFTQQPENLSNFSDIDLIADPVIEKDFTSFLKKHPGVKACTIVKKSYMTSIHINLKDADLLSIDLIWKIKVKGIQLMDVDRMLEGAYTSNFGVKSVNERDNARLIGLFYGINNGAIPKKYLPFKQVLKNSEYKLDNLIYGLFEGKNTVEFLKKYIKRQPFNRYYQGFKNKFTYLTDSLRTILFYRGMIITFSGVDGAGKSTIIEELKYKVEKQLRKRVVVLRHRPSILPILSSWTKGKKQAEMDAINSLPRKGSNGSFLSSILRFGYYYMDYLIGQLYVQVRYIWRGYVVIYDRYYFDFINDPKRSNIALPKSIAQFGFLFLLKPKFNFFIYATAEKIMARKQELDKTTIEALNQSYKKQFDKLSLKTSHSKYISIDNTNLEQTLDTIFYQITRKSA